MVAFLKPIEMHSESDAVQEPEKILLEFISAMNAWERTCADRSREWKGQGRIENDRVQMEETNARDLEQIFAKYCAPNQSRTQAMVWRRPPEYDLQTEKIIEVAQEGAKCRIRTEYTGNPRPEVHEYLLARSGAHWRLQRKSLVLGDKLDKLIL